MRRNLFPFLFVFSAACLNLSAKSGEHPAQHSYKPGFTSFTGKIIGDKVRMRLHPNLEGHIVREIPKGEIFAVVGETEGYYAVRPTQDMKAYIYRTYVLENQVEAEHVNIRLHPNLEAPIVAQLNSGDKVDVQLTPDHSKWYEIAIPPEVNFWIAKEYLEEIGPIGFAEKYRERVNEANQLIATAELITQSEYRKNFQEIDLKRLVQNFEKIIKDYQDLDAIKEKATQCITSLEKQYCAMKIDFLEGKAGKAAVEVQNLNAKLSSLDHEILDPTSLMQEVQPAQLTLDFKGEMTDKMKVWQPLEYALFQSWAQDHPESKPENFYGEEKLNSEQVSGIIEPFNTLIKHKPGDFVLTQNGQTVAYLYSTHINLQEKVGKKVVLKVSERNNHNFAFPAYYVLEIEN